MAANANTDRINRLQTYAEGLKAKLAGNVPAKHAHAPEAFKQMLEIDLKKTQARIDKLR